MNSQHPKELIISHYFRGYRWYYVEHTNMGKWGKLGFNFNMSKRSSRVVWKLRSLYHNMRTSSGRVLHNMLRFVRRWLARRLSWNPRKRFLRWLFRWWYVWGGSIHRIITGKYRYYFFALPNHQNNKVVLNQYIYNKLNLYIFLSLLADSMTG